ncbi:MAG TPA: hypothetical protein DCQ04_06215 [Actinobacteria bacterium]|nr:hypothetical protein [Actinomycetota bacterium]
MYPQEPSFALVVDVIMLTANSMCLCHDHWDRYLVARIAKALLWHGCCVALLLVGRVGSLEEGTSVRPAWV